MIGPLNHVGVAVPDIGEAIGFYRNMLGAADISKPAPLPDQGVTFAFVSLPSGQIELIEPLGEASPLHTFLRRHPRGGQHHICFEVGDVRAAMRDMEAKGLRVLGTPRPGAHGTDVVFLHPANPSAVLIELMETPSA